MKGNLWFWGRHIVPALGFYPYIVDHLVNMAASMTVFYIFAMSSHCILISVSQLHASTLLFCGHL